MAATWPICDDESFARVPVSEFADLFRRGVRVLAGYAGPGSTGKHLTTREISAWEALGSPTDPTGILALAEGTGREPLESPSSGAALAKSARDGWTALGLPKTVAICHAVDLNVGESQWQGPVAQYFDSCLHGDPTKPTGYVEADAGIWLVDHGHIAAFGSPAAYKWSSPAVLLTPANAPKECCWTQEHNGVSLDGGNVDQGHVRPGSPYVWWLQHTSAVPSKPVASHTGDIDMATIPQVKQGDSGTPVRVLQGLLNAHGSSITIDGQAGPKTIASLKTYQKSVGVTADGVAGPVTYTHLLGAK